MAEDAERHALRATFDKGAEGYDDARPVAPPEVLDELVSLARLEPGSRLLEIGCGTGQATLPLAERGFSILAVELGANLAELARSRLAGYPDVEVVTSSFEEWDPDGARFHATVAFNSFHWIDPEVRFAKPASVLRPGGALGVFGTTFALHDDADPLWLSLQEDYAALVDDPRPRVRLDDLRDRSAEFTEDGHFASVVRNLHRWDAAFTTDEYLALHETFSWCRRLPDDVRAELFDRIRRKIDAGGGTVRPTTSAVLYLATTAA